MELTFFTKAACPACWVRSILFGCTMLISLLFAGCGGSSASPSSAHKINTPISSSSLSNLTTSSSTGATTSIPSSLLSTTSVRGRVTYDFIPHGVNGLDYGATIPLPARNIVVELIDENNRVIATTTTDTDGKYAIETMYGKRVKVRVKAQLLSTQSPGWDFKVSDNTNGNALYAMSGALLAATEEYGVRDLHAPSGWSGTGYSETRVAAPFAILDSIYVAVERIHSSGNIVDFPELELRWSPKNKAAEGQLELGEIGTTFYRGDAIYVLGDENNDTDEYDRHVILHEWAHYIEENFSRTDNIGGDHSLDAKLDMRVAMSEGFANAFSAMILDDKRYRDSNGNAQGKGFSFDVSSKDNPIKGWYSEASVQSIIFNFYDSNHTKTLRGFSDIFQVINARDFVNFAGLTSIFLFADQLRTHAPGHSELINNLLIKQNIAITDKFGTGESNSGGHHASLPVYKSLPLSGGPVTVCSSNASGTYNKLNNAQYLLVDITTPGNYQFVAQERSDSGDANPQFRFYHRGALMDAVDTNEIDRETLTFFLQPGRYILELRDRRVSELGQVTQITACFDVYGQLLN